MLSQETIGNSLTQIYRKYILPGRLYIVTTIVLMLSAYLAYFGSNNIFMALLGLFAGAIGLIYLYRYREHGLLIIIFASFFVSYTIGTGTGTGINATILLVLALTGLWLVDMLLIKGVIRFVDSRTIVPLLLIILVSFLAFVNGQLRWFNFAEAAPILAQVGGLMMFVLSVAAFLVVVHLVKDTIWLKRMVWLFIFIGALFILTRFSASLVSFGNRAFAYGSSASASLFWLWLVTLTASQGLFNKQLSKPVRVVTLAIMALTVYFSTIVAYDWKSGWIPSMTALLVIVWIGAPKLRPLALPAAGLLLLLNFIDLPALITGNEDYSVLTRWEAWRILWEIIQVNPFLGLGPSNYYWYTELFPILGYAVAFNSHNNYIDIVAQIGVFGLVFFLWFFWELTKTAFRMLSQAAEGFDRAYVIGAIGGIAGMLVAGMLGDWLIPFVYNVGLVGFRSSVFGWMFLGGLVALEQIYKQKSLSTHSPETSPAEL
jgi:O-antigen ligase